MYPFLVERMIENSCCNVVFELLLAGVKEYDMLWQPIWKRYLLLKDWVWNLEQNVVMVPEHIKQKVSREVPNSAVKMATGSEPDHVGCTVLLIFFEIFVPELEKKTVATIWTFVPNRKLAILHNCPRKQWMEYHVLSVDSI